MKKLELLIENYNAEFLKLAKIDPIIAKKIKKLYNQVLDIKKKKKKIIIVGNGGSAAIASHFSVDMTKNGNIRCVNFNESDLLTCFSNDYGYEQWIGKAVEFYGDTGDVFIGISSSGSSENILNGCHAAREKNFSKVITLSGMQAENPLRQLGDINLLGNSMSYNHIENVHQVWLLTLVDLIIGKAEYTA